MRVRGAAVAIPPIWIALAAGCASPDFAVSPGYLAPGVESPGAASIAIALDVKDLRPRKGERRKSGGEVLARGTKGSVYVDRPYEEIVREGLEEALSARGFRIAEGAGVTVAVELRRLGLEAKDFTDWPTDPETSSTLDAIRILVPRKPRETRAETDLLVRVRKPGWEAGFVHLAQKESAELDSDRGVVERTLSAALTQAIEEVAARAASDIPRAAALPVSEAEFHERKGAIASQEGEMDALRREVEAQRRSLDEERREIERAKLDLEKENRALASNLAEKLGRLEARESENRKLREQIESERARVLEERAELERWESSLRTSAVSEPPPRVVETRPPLIVVTSPEGRERVTTRAELRVEGVAFSTRGIRSIELAVNGRALGAERAVGGLRRDPGESTHRRFRRDLTLREGRNRIAVRAVDADGAGVEEEIVVVLERERGDVHVVAVGIDSYQDREIPPLKFAAKDAAAVASALEEKLGLSRAASVEVLANEKATRREIKMALGSRLLARESRPDTVFIYFSGHGAVSPSSAVKDGLEKYLLPSDADTSDYGATAISMEEIADMLEHLESERVVFIADTCYSGAAGGRTVKPRGRDFRALPSESIEDRLQGAGRVILTASNASEVAQEMEDLGHGVFTFYLLRALKGDEADANADRRLEIREVYEYVRAQVRERTGGTQNPRMSSTGGDIAIGMAPQGGAEGEG